MNKLIFIFLILVSGTHLFAQEGYPEPTEKSGLLFYIQHNRGKNTFVYALNKDDEKNPIRVYRQIFDKEGEVRPLTTLQRNFAYGIDCKKLNNQNYEATIVSLPTQKFYLHIPKKGNAFVETTINGVNMTVSRIFIQQKDGTSGLSTKVDYILFYGKHNNKATVQKLIP